MIDPEVATRVLAQIRAAADPDATVAAYGSIVYAPAQAGDVDVLVSNDAPDRLAAALGLTTLPTRPPRLHGMMEGVPVDVTIVNGDDDLARRMRAGPRDAALLAARLREHERDEVFQAAWPHVRQFVRLRALGHNGLGWFGSFGWALLLAIPLVVDAELRVAQPGEALPGWLRWLSRLAVGARVGFDGIRGGEQASLVIAAPAPPPRDVANLSKRAASWLVAEGRAAALATAGAMNDADAIAGIADLATTPPPGKTLVITGNDDHGRGRYDGTARGLLRELEALGAVRSWGRFDEAADGSWQHRITVPAARAVAARTIVENWLALANLDAEVSAG